jgi:hypothetical protein
VTDIQDEVGECIFGDGVELYDEDDDDIVLPLVADEGTIDQLVQRRTTKQLKERVYSVGLHHGQLNTLPGRWKYPNKLSLIQLINLWLLGGGQKSNVPPLKNLDTCCVLHFDPGAREYSRMKHVMKRVQEFGCKRNVWLTKSKAKLLLHCGTQHRKILLLTCLPGQY